jgi:glutamyl/glutaminyl-tRNA synthetase
MASNEDSWRLGEFVFPPRTSKLLKSSGSKSYNSLIASRYICIREATERQNGILLRVEGKVKAKHMMLVCGQPFCKDDSVQLFEGWSYFSYSFPTVAELAEVLKGIDDFTVEGQEPVVMKWVEEKQYKLGDVMNAFRLALVGIGKGPGMFDISAYLGKEETVKRLYRAVEVLK